MQNHNGLVVGLVALLAMCACLVGLAALAVVGGAGLFYAQSQTATPLPTLDPTQIVTTMDTIEAWVVATRGLQPKEPVERKFLTVDEVRQRTIDNFKKDYSPEEAAADAQVLAAFGLIKPGLDIYNLFIRLYSEGVAGLYDPDTKELVLVSEAQGFNAYERTVFAHEYNHAMQDQNFGIRSSGFSDEMANTDIQRFSAVQAVMEGDASLLEEQYKDTLSKAELREYDDAVNAVDISLYYELPNYLLSDFLFPYQQGLDFVRRYYDLGGWARVDEVWHNLPVSTEQIIHPELYDAGEAPVVVARPPLTDTLGSGWRLLDSDVNGEWYTYLILAHANDSDARLTEATALKAAAGWGGDGYNVYGNDAANQIVLAQEWVWDTQADADEFVAAFKDYARKRFEASPTEGAGGRQCWGSAPLNCFFVNGDHTLWLMAPDEATLDLVLSQYAEY